METSGISNIYLSCQYSEQNFLVLCLHHQHMCNNSFTGCPVKNLLNKLESNCFWLWHRGYFHDFLTSLVQNTDGGGFPRATQSNLAIPLRPTLAAEGRTRNTGSAAMNETWTLSVADCNSWASCHVSVSLSVCILYSLIQIRWDSWNKVKSMTQLSSNQLNLTMTNSNSELKELL